MIVVVACTVDDLRDQLLFGLSKRREPQQPYDRDFERREHTIVRTTSYCEGASSMLKYGSDDEDEDNDD